MRRAYRLVSLALVLAGIAAASASGCIFHYEDDCEATHDCPLGSGGGPPAGCGPRMNSTPVDDTCGVFVSSSKGNDATGRGTKAAPYQTLQHALDKAKGQPVYACAEAFAGSVTLASESAVYGGLDCTKSWA